MTDPRPAGRVIHTGQAIVDIVLGIDQMPEPGGDVFAHSSQITAGGGFNVMAAAARDHAPVIYAGALGTGPFAALVTQALTSEGIATPTHPITGMDTGYSIAIVDATAERTFVSVRGAEAHNSLQNLQEVTVQADDVIYVSGYSLMHPANRDALCTWLPTLPPTTMIFDPSPLIDQIPTAAIDIITARHPIWSLNAREAALIAGAQTDDATTAQILARTVDAPVVMRCGPHGAYVSQPGEPTRHCPAPTVEAIDTNGAGDAHAGVMAAALAQGTDLVPAVQRANIAAAIAVTRSGPATAPTTTEINHWADPTHPIA